MSYGLEDILDAREERWNIRQTLACSLSDGCLISVTLCVPLIFRCNNEFKELFKKLCDRLISFFPRKKIIIKFEEYICGADGPVMFFSSSLHSGTIKRLCVMAEESLPGARLLDVDVTSNKGEVIGREHLGLPPRKCFVCSNPSYMCVSRRLHSSEDIALAVKKLYEEAIE